MILQVGNAMITMMLVKLMLNDIPHALALDPEYMKWRREQVDKYGSWAVGRAESLCSSGDRENVERVAASMQALALAK